MTDIHIISDSQTLAEKCAQLNNHPYLAMDTEFLRATSYWPQLCLIQIGYEGEGVLIDPLAPNLNLSPFFDLLTNPNITKVFHDARQDIEIFYHDRQIFPSPIFDTQIAAMACGFGNHRSYEQLVRVIEKKRIDKSSRVTDWSKRPLTKKQLSYALSDVTHLCGVYSHLLEILKKEKRLHWVQDEFDALCRPEIHEKAPENAWRQLKFRATNPRQQYCLQAIAGWREKEARKKNKPRGWIMSDNMVREMMVAADQSFSKKGQRDKLQSSFKKLFQSKSGRELKKMIAQTREVDFADMELENGTARANNKNDTKLAMLKLLLKVQCDHHHVAPPLIATPKEIESFANHPDGDHPINRGFRYEVFGKSAHDLLRGKISLAFSREKPSIIKTVPLAPKK